MTNNLDLQIHVISVLLGAAILIITSITQLEKYQENWIEYRTTAELLKKERYFIKNGAVEYTNLYDDAKRKLLVECIESLISSETNSYFTMHHPQKSQAEPTK